MIKERYEEANENGIHLWNRIIYATFNKFNREKLVASPWLENLSKIFLIFEFEIYQI